MANLSEVSGVVSYSGNDIQRLGYKKILQFLYDLYNHMDKWCYNFSPWNFVDITPEELENFSEEKAKEYIENYEKYGSFIATGRWTFESIISSFSENKDIREFYKKHDIRDFTFHMSYDELETGCEVFCVDRKVDINIKHDASEIDPDKGETYFGKSHFSIIKPQDDGTQKIEKIDTETIIFNDGYKVSIKEIKNGYCDITRENIEKLKYLAPDSEYDYIWEYLTDINDYSHDQIDYFMNENDSLINNYPGFRWDKMNKKLFKNDIEYITKYEQKLRNGGI